jgi:hypothetical protein
MNYISKLSAVARGLSFLACALLSACDTQVYTDQELEAQERFRGVEVGAAEQDVRTALGTPSSVAARSGSDKLSFQSADEGARKRTMSLDANDRSKWPEDLKFLPKMLRKT